MPAELDLTDLNIMDALLHTAEHAAKQGKDLGSSLNNIDELRVSLGQTATFDCLDYYATEEAESRFETLRKAAKQQQTSILHGARLFLEKRGKSKEEITEILLNTKALGRQFARVGGRMYDESETTADNHLAKFIAENPDLSFEYENDCLRFNESTQRFIKAHSDARTGCPAMKELFEWEGNKQTLFDAFWDIFTAQYVDNYTNDQLISIPLDSNHNVSTS